MDNLINDTKILEGRSLAQEITDQLGIEVGKLKIKNIHPHLAVIMIGEDKNSQIFVNLKKKKSEEIGIDFSLYKIKNSDKEEDVIALIKHLNEDREINGIIVQLPIHKAFNTQKILQSIDPAKDVDALKDNKYPSPVVCAVRALIEKYKLPQEEVLIIGKGQLIGKPLIKDFDNNEIKYTVWEEKDFNESKISKFTLIICATGKKWLLNKPLDLDEQYIIDAGCGDVNFDELFDCVAGLTPPVGGVGPLTIAFLLKNVVEATKEQQITKS